MRNPKAHPRQNPGEGTPGYILFLLLSAAILEEHFAQVRIC